MSARRSGTTVAAALLALVALLSAAAPMLPLPHEARIAPERAGRAPAPRLAALDPVTAERSADEHPTGFALRRALFGDLQVEGALGTDRLGRDLAARIAWGGRVSLMVGLVATLVSVLIGVTWGAIAGFLGGRADALMMRVVDALYAIPLMFVVILVVALLREVSDELRAIGVTREVVLFAVIGATSWLTMARIVRGQVLSLRERDFVEAARALGAGRGRILRRHLLPHLWGLVAVYLTLTIPRVILVEAFLSFLGLGVEPPSVSWGILAAESLESLTPVSRDWWLVVFPGAALVITLSTLNALGDALRDALDPRLARRAA